MLCLVFYVFVNQLYACSILAQDLPFINTENIIKRIIISDDTINVNYDTDTLCLHTNDFIEFEFFSSKQLTNSYYRFYLGGIDRDTSKWTLKNSVHYSNLKEGVYTFYVESKQSSQTVTFHVDSLFSRYYLSTIVLIIVAVLSLLALKVGIGKKISHWQTDPLIPLFKKYLKTQSKPILDQQKLSQKISERYDKATVLFADIQGFTKIAEHLNPETLIDELDRFFIRFDEVAEKNKIEKIKTIGDAYMCAGGLPEKNSTNPIEVVLAALEMQRYMKKTSRESEKGSTDFWELRIGIHTGPVISGIIGSKKLSFDIWGDTVNIASRMESSGVAGKINISGVTYQLIKDFFECEYRGKMPIKYKGETDMYFVKGIKSHLSVNHQGEFPNEEFYTKLQWIRYNDLEELIIRQLRNELPGMLKFHNVKHTLEVCTQVEVIGRSEGLTNKELLLVKTAALLHDTGYMIGYLQHEVQSVRIAKELLPMYAYSPDEIEEICQLILVTIDEAVPLGIMDQVMKDADLEYIGRADFALLSDKLWKEHCHFYRKVSKNDWNKMQYNFVSNHSYHTKTANELRQVDKEIQLKKLIET
jgi:class 3 adenylate cyclase